MQTFAFSMGLLSTAMANRQPTKMHAIASKRDFDSFYEWQHQFQ